MIPDSRYAILAVCFILISTSVLSGQNLVPNPGFERFHNCPPYLGQIQEAVAWESPNNNTTDYFHACSPIANGASVPENSLGEQPPALGNAYAGIRTWIPVIAGNPIYREYLSVQLTVPLQAGVEYAVTFQVSLAESSSHATDDLGAYFSKTALTNERLYQVTPQIQNTKDKILTNKKEWITISGTFIAEGGEAFLAIGTFKDDEEMTRLSILTNEEPKVYYYIDEVEVSPCTPPAHLLQIQDTSFCKGEVLELFGPAGAQSYQWDNLTSTVNRELTKAGTYQVISRTVCYELTNIFRVEEEECTCQPTIFSPQLIEPLLDGGKLKLNTNDFTQVRHLILFDALGRMVVQLTGDELSNFAAPQLAAGIYFYSLAYDCIDLLGKKVASKQTGKFVALR